MIKGVEVLNSIQANIGSRETLHRKSLDFVNNLEVSINSLFELREDLLEDLAREFLPELEANSLHGSLIELKNNITNHIRVQDLQTKKINDTLNKLEHSRNDLENQISSSGEQLDILSSKRDELEELASQELEKIPNYQDLRTKIEQVSAQIVQNQQRVTSLNQEQEEKLPAYNDCPLFSYLVSSKYRTDSYKKKGLTRVLDSWVAGITDFNKHKRLYDFLNEVPKMVGLEVQRRKEELESLLKEVKVYEEEVFNKIGLSNVIKDGIQLGEIREDLLEDLEELESKMDKKEETLEILESGKGNEYEKALDLISEFFKIKSLTELKDLARKKAGTTDDKIVLEIEKIENRLKNKQSEFKQISNEYKGTAKSLEKLRRLKNWFVRNNFDSDRSFFKNSPMGIISSGDFNFEQAKQQFGKMQSFQRQMRTPLGKSYRDSGMSDELTRAILQGMGNIAGGMVRRRSRSRGSIFGGGPVFRGMGGKKGTIFGSGHGGGGFSSGEGF